MACPCQETERVSACAETANPPVNATIKQTDILLIEILHWIETTFSRPSDLGLLWAPL